MSFETICKRTMESSILNEIKMVKYGCLVRNAEDAVVQIAYSGCDTCGGDIVVCN